MRSNALSRGPIPSAGVALVAGTTLLVGCVEADPVTPDTASPGPSVLASGAASMAPGTVTPAQVGAATGGTELALSISQPPDGVLVGRSAADPLAFSGEASIGPGTQTLIYMLDVSLAAEFPLGWMMEALVALNEAAIQSGIVEEVAVIPYAEFAEPADMSPGPEEAVFTGPATDASGSGTPDVHEVIQSAFIDRAPQSRGCVISAPGEDDDGQDIDCPSEIAEGEPSFSGISQFTLRGYIAEFNDFQRAVRTACEVAQQASSPNVTVMVLHTGNANQGGNADAEVPCTPRHATFHAVLPPWTGCGAKPNFGALDEITELTGGECIELSDVADMAAAVAGLAPSPATLDAIGVAIPEDIEHPLPATTSPDLPVAGPVSVSWSGDLAFGPGIVDICASATASTAGVLDVEVDCRQVTVAEVHVWEPLGPIDLADRTTFDVLATVGRVGTRGIEFEVEDIPVAFEVLAGPNAGAAGTGITDDLGTATFGLTNPNQDPSGLGTDVVEACFSDDLGNEECAQAEVVWANLSPPVAGCTVTRGPDGEPMRLRSDSEVRGFLRLAAEDVIDPDPQVFVRDTGTGEIFGPFADGDVVRYTRAPGPAPDEGEFGGPTSDVVAHLMGSGDPMVFARDLSENESDPVPCSGEEAS